MVPSVVTNLEIEGDAEHGVGVDRPGRGVRRGQPLVAQLLAIHDLAAADGNDGQAGKRHDGIVDDGLQLPCQRGGLFLGQGRSDRRGGKNGQRKHRQQGFHVDWGGFSTSYPNRSRGPMQKPARRRACRRSGGAHAICVVRAAGQAG
jgi:hypothetical protein